MELEQVRKKSFFLITALMVFTFFLFGVSLIINKPLDASTDTPSLHQYEDLTIIEINPEIFELHAANDTKEPKLISEWNQKLNSEVIINGAFFESDYTPSGYFKLNKKIVGKGTLGNHFTAFLGISDEKVKINENLAKDKFYTVIQGYPLLVRDSKQHLTKSTPEQAKRSAIGVDQNGNIYFIISDISLSLLEFTNSIIDTSIEFDYVLNLDGGPSSGLYSSFVDQAVQIDNSVKVPSVLYVLRK